MRDLNTNQKIAIAAIVVAVLMAVFFWYTSPFNTCLRAGYDPGYCAVGR